MVELVYTSDLKSDAERIAGSSPATRTIQRGSNGIDKLSSESRMINAQVKSPALLGRGFDSLLLHHTRQISSVVEHCFCKAAVVGSSPTSGSTYNSRIAQLVEQTAVNR